MQKYIYKIENMINHNIYIGQSNDPKRRYREHRTTTSTSLIHLAILKYGEENFQNTILEGPIENYNERERYWIEYYHCWVKDPLYQGGYNLTPGGEEPPILKGENNNNTTHTIEQVMMAKRLLKETDIPLIAIADACGYADRSAIERINVGKIWNDPNENYPLRVLPLSKQSNRERWETIASLLYNTDLTQNEIAQMCGCQRSCVTMINIGENGRDYNNGKYSYPIREKNAKQKRGEDTARAIAHDLATTELTYQEIFDKYNCGSTFVSQINQGKNYKFDIYTYPIRKYYNKPVETMEGQSSSTSAIDTQGETGIATNDNQQLRYSPKNNAR